MFARSIAYDLKTPIANIVNPARVLELRHEQADELIESLRQLVGSTEAVRICVDARITQVRVHRGILMQILVDLVTNAIN